MSSEHCHRSFRVHGDLLRKLRLARGWSQLDAARRADLSDRIVRTAEAGGPISARTITAIACLYDTREAPLSPEQLLMDRNTAFMEPPAPPNTAAMLKRWFDGLWNNLDLSVIDELIIPEFAFHSESGVVRNRQEMRERVLRFRESFSDFDFVVEQTSDLVDAVVCRWRVAMTHSGTWLDLPATGKRVVVHGSSWVQIVGDKFGDAWDYWDPGNVYQQLSSFADFPSYPPSSEPLK